MKTENKYKDFEVLTTKDISLLSEVSLRTADRIKALIKKEFKIKKVTFYYYKKYYCM